MRLHSPEETRRWAEDFATQLKRPCVVLLDGDLGAGKTQTVRYFLSALGVKESASPTFAIHHEYRSSSGPIDHVDLYRVNSDADLETTGFWDLFLREDGLVFVEWAARLPEDIWPEAWQQVYVCLKKVIGQEEWRDLEVRVKPPGPK
jgi:tRNA threonylcarbamoyladenosine biosynthesis protein TsaE